MRSPATVSEESPMLVEYILGGVVTVALLIFLTYALLRPEKF
jgi:K+-transporting ATPase KdpF subunit